MSDQGRIEIPIPPGICPDCMQSPEQAGASAIGIVAHCKHSMTGGIMPLLGDTPSGLWILFYPIAAEDFADRIAKLVREAQTLAQAGNSPAARVN